MYIRTTHIPGTNKWGFSFFSSSGAFIGRGIGEFDTEEEALTAGKEALKS